jgi:hypothetical protein
MSAAFANQARAEGIPTEYLVWHGENHFSVTTALGMQNHALTRKSIALVAAS